MPRRHFDRPCATCGKVYWPSNSLQRFCSRPCSDAASVKPRDPCPVCGNNDRKLGFLTCGASCGYQYRKLRTRAPRPCAGCGKPFMPTPSALLRASGKFCSMDCFRQVQSLRPAMIQATCEQCGSAFRRTQAAVRRVKRSFCSRGCAHAFNSGVNHTNWRGGSDPNRGQGWRKLAEEIRDRDGYRCRRCGKTQEQEGRRLSVDHIIPWRTFTDAEEANAKSNLASLCGSCHSKKARAERLWLKGDVLDMWQYQIAVAQPWTRP